MKEDNKNILIISYYYNIHNANALCLEPILNYLGTKGYNVHVLCCHNKPHNSQDRTFEHRIPSILLDIKTTLDERMERNLLWKIVGMAFQLLAYLLSFESIFEAAFLSQRTVKYARNVIDAHKIRNILSISHPVVNHQLAFILKEECQECCWTMYQFDPYTYNYGMSETEQPARRQIEQKLLDLADKIILTEGIWEENKRMHLGNEFEDKTMSVPLPNLMLTSNTASRTPPDFDASKINLVFAGNIYSGIRKPEVIFEILSRLNDPEFYLHIYGWGMERVLKNYPRIANQVYLHGRVPKEEVIEAMSAASILINFGNSMINQTPSKVFDYISSGKPIINFCFSDNDSSSIILNRYPLFLNIRNDEALGSLSIDKFVNFCRKQQSAFVHRNEIETLFNDLLSDKVCDKIQSFISS